MKLCTAQSCLEMAPALSVHWLMFAPATLPLSIRICWLLVLDGLLGERQMRSIRHLNVKLILRQWLIRQRRRRRLIRQWRRCLIWQRRRLLRT